MKNLILTACVAVLCAVAGVRAQTVACDECYDYTVLSGTMPESRTLSASTKYLISGCYVVPNGLTLTIPPGTQLFGDATNKGMLIVDTGGVLIADGQPNPLVAPDPIIFTSCRPVDEREPGDWGGITILGRAENNSPTGLIEIERCSTQYYAGRASNPVNNENSGTIRYVQIHYAGGGNTGDGHVNGLTLVSVGNGTVADHVQVAYSAGDAFSLLGGTVDMQFLFSLNAFRNDVLFSEGNTSRLQYLLAIRKDTGAHYIGGSHGILIQNTFTAPYSGTPLTAPTISNASIIGPGACNAGPFSGEFQDAVRYANNGAGSIYNSVVMQWPEYGLYIDGGLSVAHTATNALNFSYNSFFDNGAGPYSFSPSWSGGCGGSMAAWINGSGTSCFEDGNQTADTDPAYDASTCGDYCDEMFVPDFVIDDGSTELDVPDFSWPGGSTWFDDAAEYRGAIQAEDLYTSWSDLCPGKTDYCPENKSRTEQSEYRIQIVPNPARGTAYVVLDAAYEGNVRIQILDKVSGQTFRTIDEQVITGSQRVAISVNGLQAGIYIVKVSLQDGRILTGQLFVL